MLNGLDLFSGIGGISLALKCYVRTVAYCEIDRYCQAVLLSRMSERKIDQAPIWDDITTLSKEELRDFPRIDIITGGFPCQDISVAGSGKGLEGKRSGLFFEIVRLVKEIEPSFVFLENVPAIRTRGLLRVADEFTKMGYDCRWTCLSASSVGAPHKRERWFFLAHFERNRGRPMPRVDSCAKTKLTQLQQENWQSCADYPSEGSSTLANCNLKGLEEQPWPNSKSKWQRQRKTCDESVSKGQKWVLEPDVGRSLNGLLGWLDEVEHRSFKISERIINYAQEAKLRPEEILQVLLKDADEKTILDSFKEYELISPKKILQSLLFGIQKRWADKSRLQLEIEKASQGELQGLWMDEAASRKSYRSNQKEQESKGHSEEHSDSLKTLAQILEIDAEEAWFSYRWGDADPFIKSWPEDWDAGMSRVCQSLPYRAHRIKSLGNSVVPLQVKKAFERLIGLEQFT